MNLELEQHEGELRALRAEVERRDIAIARAQGALCSMRDHALPGSELEQDLQRVIELLMAREGTR